MKIKKIDPSTLEAYLAHLARHFAEYGVGGIIAQPFPIDEPWDQSDFRPKILERWYTADSRRVKIEQFIVDCPIGWN